jgi:vacuolar protein sorting-associated protein 13A/C
MYIFFIFKGAIEGLMKFAEGIGTDVRTLFGLSVDSATDASSKITDVLGKDLATLTFDEEYKISCLKRKEAVTKAMTDMTVGEKYILLWYVESFLFDLKFVFFFIVKVFVDGVSSVVTKLVLSAKQDGTSGFMKGLGKGFISLMTRLTDGIVDFACTSLNIIK